MLRFSSGKRGSCTCTNQLNHLVYALDSTTIDLCLALFLWAKFRKKKDAVKMHTLPDLRGSIPTVVVVTHGKVHDVNILDKITIELGALYVVDRGYTDFARLHGIHQSGAFFVIQAKVNFRFRRLYSQIVDKSTGVQCDQTVIPANFYAKKDYSSRIRYYDTELQKRLVFLTNNFVLPAKTIADLYRCR